MARPTETVDLDERKRLTTEGSKGVTLDGHPAYVSGFLNEYATIRRRDGKGGGVEFSWVTTKRILRRHGRFES